VLLDLRYYSGICLEGLKKLKKNPLGGSESKVMEVSIAWFEILYWHLHGGTEEIQERPHSELESMVMEVGVA
jgi:hypothetical protein